MAHEHDIANHAQHGKTQGLPATLGVIIALHVIGLALLVVGLVAGPAGALTIGMGAVAYGLGLRHAADADHIAMIDNSTRKFVGEGKAHASVGLAFSAGHSTVVVGAGIAVVAGAAWIKSVLEPESQAAWVLGIIGGSVAGLYLLAVAAANIPQIVAAVRALQTGSDLGPTRGLIARMLQTPLKKVTHPAHIYFFGLLFGLGFDTASSVSILMLTGASAIGHSIVPVAMLAMPVLFAAAMTLGDTANALVMLRLYRSAVARRRRVWFNLVITSISVVSAMVIAAITISGVVVDDLGISVPGLAEVAGVDTEWWGFVLMAIFAAFAVAAGVMWLTRRRSAATQG